MTYIILKWNCLWSMSVTQSKSSKLLGSVISVQTSSTKNTYLFYSISCYITTSHLFQCMRAMGINMHQILTTFLSTLALTQQKDDKTLQQALRIGGTTTIQKDNTPFNWKLLKKCNRFFIYLFLKQ